MRENTADAAKTRMRKAQARHEVLEEDNRRLREMLLFLNESEARKNRLADYYFGAWLEDVDALPDTDFDSAVMDQDTLYDELVQRDRLVRQLLLFCAETLQRE